MRARRCLILAAGFGTRMGPIGTRLPKVMWPVFGKPLLELQLLFARKLGYTEIWINLHHQADIIRSMTASNSSFEGVRWLREHPEILDIGGAIHNLASRPSVSYQGELLVLNADQFLWFTAEELVRWRSQAASSEVLLLNWGVDSSQGYNQVLSDVKRNFLRVVKNVELPRGMRMETYSGNSLINLEQLRPHPGATAFFDSICNPALHRCQTALISAGRYWDFGTAQRYWSSIQGIMRAKIENDEDPFTRFLEETGAFQRQNLSASSRSYGTAAPGVMNFGSGAPAMTHPPGVILQGEPLREAKAGAFLVYEGEAQSLP